jgi:hypothetical protein
MPKLKKIFLVLFFIVVVSGTTRAIEKNSHFDAALKLVELSWDSDQVYQDYIYSGLRSAEEKLQKIYQKKPYYRKYNELFLNVIKESMDYVYLNADFPNILKNAEATLFTQEFTENELNEIIGALLIFEKKGESLEESSALNKLDQKLPIILKKSWDLGIEKSQEVISLSEYSKLIDDKIEALKESGQLPENYPE